MTDQCIHCTVRGNLDECKQTKCFQHESWYAQQMIAEIERNRAAIAELVGALSRVMLWIHNWQPEFEFDPEWPEDRDAARAALTKHETPTKEQ